MPAILISDANILIDMEEGGILEDMFRLPYEFATPDILFEEELSEEHAHLIHLGLVLKEVSSDSMAYVVRLTETYTRTSRNDCFALALARQENCPLLSGDMALRQAAEQERAQVYGTIWVIERLITENVISVERATAAYTLMKSNGRRLPWDLVQRSLDKFN